MEQVIVDFLALILLIVKGDLGLFELGCMLALWGPLRSLLRHPSVEAVERRFTAIAGNKPLAILVLAGAAVLIRVALLPFLHVPNPAIADEFSHLLLADTLRHGRLANETHPLWQHMESIHIFHQPVYTSMYLPGQALFLAVGWVLGHPWIGVLISSALMIAAIVWMLQAWLPPRWAFLGGTLALLKFSLASYWINSYWGGCVPAAGGALVLGAYARLEQGRRAHAVLMGCGVALLAVTRPYEGVVFSAVVCGLVMWRLVREGPAFRSAVFRTYIGMIALVLAAAAAMLMAYNARVTGSPFRLPYEVNRKLYGWPMTLPWYKPPFVEFHHESMRLYYEWERGELERKLAPWWWANYGGFYVQVPWRFFLGVALAVPMLWARRVVRDRRIRPVLLIGAVTATAVVLEHGYPHYLAPAAACVVLFTVQCIRHMRCRPAGLVLSRAVVATLVLAVVVRSAGFGAGQTHNWQSWCCSTAEGDARARLARLLEQVPGEHVVFVRYDRKAFTTREWVYNGADIDGARIVWVHDMGQDADLRVVRHYPGRSFWVAEPDWRPETLSRWPALPAIRIEGLTSVDFSKLRGPRDP